MKNLWKLNTKPSDKNITDYCFNNNVMAIGWSLCNETIERFDDNIKNEILQKRSSMSSYNDLDSIVRKYNIYDINVSYYSIRRLANEVEIGDLVWMRDNGIYFLGRVSETSKYKYEDDDDVRKIDAANQRDGIEWIKIEEKDIASNIKNINWRGTLTRIWSDELREFSKKLYNNLSGE